MKKFNFLLFLLLFCGGVTSVLAQKSTDAYYPTHLSDLGETHSRSDRYINSLSLTGGSGSVSVPNTRNLYNEFVGWEEGFTVTASSNVTAVFNCNAPWMHRYVFLDFGNDGAFNVSINSDYTINDRTDIASFNYYSPQEYTSGIEGGGFDSHGGSGVRSGDGEQPSFTTPAQPGFYRMRFKTDWNDVLPKSNNTPGNTMSGNGGQYVDVRLHVHNENSTLTTDATGCVIQTVGGEALPSQITNGEDYTIKVVPNGSDYALQSMTIRYGYNLDNSDATPFLDDMEYWKEVNVTESQLVDGKYTLPAEITKYDVKVTAHYIAASYDYYDIVYVGVPEGVTPTIHSTQGTVVGDKFKCLEGTVLDVSTFTVTAPYYESSVSISGTTITVTCSAIDMTDAPVQNGLYLINSVKYSGDYLQYNEINPDNLSFEAKTTDGNSYMDVACVEKKSGTYYYTIKVKDGRYAHATGYGTSSSNIWVTLVTIADAKDITEYEKWTFQSYDGIDGFNIKPNGQGYSMNPWDGHASGTKVGFYDANDAADQRWILTPVYPVTLNEADVQSDGRLAMAATFSAENNTTLPTGVNAYYSTTYGTGYITLEKLDATTLPANEGFILIGYETDKVYLESTTNDATAISGNLLEPTTGAAIPATENAYVLAKTHREVAFYLLNNTDRTLAKNKAYLLLDDAMPSVKMNFGGEATGIENVETAVNANAPIFDLSGRRVMQATKGGIYIQNGKKFIVK